VYCAGIPKREAAHQAGHDIDVWIDDNPILVNLGLEGLHRFPDRQGWHTQNAELVRRERERREQGWFRAFAEGRRAGYSAASNPGHVDDDQTIVNDWRISATRKHLVSEGLIDAE
jgi:hypothetical protein